MEEQRAESDTSALEIGSVKKNAELATPPSSGRDPSRALELAEPRSVSVNHPDVSATSALNSSSSNEENDEGSVQISSRYIRNKKQKSNMDEIGAS